MFSLDVFGIPYKPFREKSYYQPTGPTFEDEEEFEKELAQNKILAHPAEAGNNSTEDEFDFDFDTGAIPQESNNSRLLLDIALARASNLYTNNDQEVEQELLSSMKLSVNISAVQEAEEYSNEDQKRGVDVILDAKNALSDVINVYGSGLGDQEVRLLSTSSNPLSTSIDGPSAKFTSSLLPSKGNILNEVIEEGDEDAEFEEELREEAEAALAMSLAQELHDEWSHISIENFMPATHNIQNSIGNNDELCTCITYHDALAYCQSLDLSRFQSLIVVGPEKSWGILGGPATLKFDDCDRQLEFPFLLAQLDCDLTVPQHLSMLQTIYMVS